MDRLKHQHSHAAKLLAAQTIERTTAASLHMQGMEAMHAHNYESAVLQFKAAVSHDVNNVALQKEYQSDLNNAVAKLELRNAARVSSQHQLGMQRS